MNQFCTPAYVYLVVSLFFVIIVALQNHNFYENRVFCIGMYDCDNNNIAISVSLKLIFILFWTFFLNLLCKMGLSFVSWILVFLPWVIMLTILGKYLN